MARPQRYPVAPRGSARRFGNRRRALIGRGRENRVRYLNVVAVSRRIFQPIESTVEFKFGPLARASGGGRSRARRNKVSVNSKEPHLNGDSPTDSPTVHGRIAFYASDDIPAPNVSRSVGVPQFASRRPARNIPLEPHQNVTPTSEGQIAKVFPCYAIPIVVQS